MWSQCILKVMLRGRRYVLYIDSVTALISMFHFVISIGLVGSVRYILSLQHSTDAVYLYWDIWYVHMLWVNEWKENLQEWSAVFNSAKWKGEWTPASLAWGLVKTQIQTQSKLNPVHFPESILILVSHMSTEAYTFLQGCCTAFSLNFILWDRLDQ